MSDLLTKFFEHPFKTAFIVSAVATGVAKILQATADFKAASNPK